MRSILRRFFIPLLLLFIFAGGISSALADSPKRDPLPDRSDVISESDYWNLVKESQQVVSGLNVSPDAKIVPELVSLAGRWTAIDSVTLDSGQVITLDNSYLLSMLNATQPDIKHISDIFKALLDAHEKYPSRVFTAQDLESLHEVMARPEFQWKEAGANPLTEFLNRILNQLLAWLNKILGGRSIRIPGSPSLLYAVAVIALVVVLFFVFRTLFVDFINDARLAEENIAEELLTSESAFQKAQALSRGGDYRSAVRFLYLSSLLLLDERGVLRYDRSKTNREYLRSISNSPELEKPLSEVIEVFDEVWYGYHSLDDDTFKHYSDRVEELKEKKQ